MTLEPDQLARPPLVLGSSSPYRYALLQRLRLPFTVVQPSIDEHRLPDETPATLATRLASAKAQAVANQISRQQPQAFIIGCDQVADLNGQVLGKPGAFAPALQQLQAMRGQTVIFHSALCLLDVARQRSQVRNITTLVKMRTLDDATLTAYLHAEQPYDCAGSAKAEALGISLLERCESSDPTALIGLPLIALNDMLLAYEYPVHLPITPVV